MSKTMTEDAMAWANERRDLFVEMSPLPKRPVLGDTLLASECDHININADGTRCLSCGVWAHELLTVNSLAAMAKR